MYVVASAFSCGHRKDAELLAAGASASGPAGLPAAGASASSGHEDKELHVSRRAQRHKSKTKIPPSGSHGLCREMVARPVTPGTPGEEGNQGEPLTLPTKMLNVHRVDLQDKSKKRGRKDRTLSFAASGASLAEQVRRSQ